MKKVRFETCDKFYGTAKMRESDCHSPRPFIEKQMDIKTAVNYHGYTRLLPFSMDPVKRFENSNSSPYPVVRRTNLNGRGPDELGPRWSPSNDLELSMFDASSHEPRPPVVRKPTFFDTTSDIQRNKMSDTQDINLKVLSPIENIKPNSSNVVKKDGSFFITRGNLHKFIMQDTNPMNNQLKNLYLDKENNPKARKLDMMTAGVQNSPLTENSGTNCSPSVESVSDCSCHHCIKQAQKPCMGSRQCNKVVRSCSKDLPSSDQCRCIASPTCCDQCHNLPVKNIQNSSECNNCCSLKSLNAVDKKTWAIQKYEQNKDNNLNEIEKQTNVKEKREPTVADLFKIIKLQNEQLQLLQEKVDKFITSGNSRPLSIPIQSYTTEHVALETVNSEEHKISIGVMTSFEMVRTSTVINKEVVKQVNDNAQIQCNRSQISIKEVVSKSEPVNLNFLDGIAPVGNTNNMQNNFIHKNNGNAVEEKTLNEFSLYNVQVDNATTPLMSPEQTLYLDVRDYSDSETGSNDQSNVGWTYYNKVMTHVNGMLQDSDMPSSASAMYRNTRQQCVQMQIDKTNVSVTKRVKFGDDPLGIYQPHIYAAATDTSLKMNQLAAKYLKNGPVPHLAPPPVVVTKSSVPLDMSFATKNYMERHKLLQGVPQMSNTPQGNDIPRFLDITALKQQPKLL